MSESSESEDVLQRVLQLRAAGCGPKQIARALGVRPAQASVLLRRGAASQVRATPAAERPVVGCWVNPGWSQGLDLGGAPLWERAEVSAAADGQNPSGAEEFPSGFAQVTVARQAQASKVALCSFLVDVYCLGVKDTLGPEMVNAGSLQDRLRHLYRAFDRPPLEVGLDQARAVVLGAVDYARALGFAPAPGFADLAPYLGPVRGDEPRIGFGRDGKPYYISGPRDDARHIVGTLERSCGTDGFQYMVATGQL